MNGRGLLIVVSTSPKQKRMTMNVARPSEPLTNIVKNMARGTLRDASLTSSAVMLLVLMHQMLPRHTHVACAIIAN